MKNIFITGATGFLGSALVERLLEDKKVQIYALIRPKRGVSLKKRKEDLLFGLSKKGFAGRIHLVKGDVSSPGLGLSKETAKILGQKIDTIFNSAAIVEHKWPLKEVRKINVTGTENVMKIALKWTKEGSLERVNHISTAYVAGDHKGKFFEKDMDVSQKFKNTYEKSKFEAEQVVQRYRKKGLSVDIFRPSTIVDPLYSEIRPNGMPLMRKLLQMFSREIFEEIPTDENISQNYIPIDIAAEIICLISMTEDRPLNQTYHIVSRETVSIGFLVDAASRILGVKKPRLGGKALSKMSNLSLAQRKLIKSLEPYNEKQTEFDMKNTLSILKLYRYKMPTDVRNMAEKVIENFKRSELTKTRSPYGSKK